MSPRICKLRKIIEVGYHLVSLLGVGDRVQDPTTRINNQQLELESYYHIMKSAIRQDYTKNPGILAMFALKQWGFKLSQQAFLSFSLAWVAITEAIMRGKHTDCTPADYLRMLRRFTNEVLSCQNGSM